MNYWIIPAVTRGKNLKITEVIEMICEDLDVNYLILKSKTREREIADKRHVAFYILNVYCGVGLERLGKYFDRTHASVIHGRNKVEYLDLLKHFKIDEARYNTIKIVNN